MTQTPRPSTPEPQISRPNKKPDAPLNWKVLVKWLSTARWWSSFSPSMSPMKACGALYAISFFFSGFSGFAEGGNGQSLLWHT